MKEKSHSFESLIWGVAMKCPECGSDQTITYAVWICPIEPKTEYTVCPTKTKKRCEDCGHVWYIETTEIPTREYKWWRRIFEKFRPRWERDPKKEFYY